MDYFTLSLHEHMGAAIERLRQQSLALLGFPSPGVHIELRQSRPSSEIARVTFAAREKSKTAFVKVLRPRQPGRAEYEFMQTRASDDFQTTKLIHSNLASRSNFSVPTPIACFPEHMAIVTEAMPGLTLRTLLERELPWTTDVSSRTHLTQALARIGCWIRDLQAIDRPGHSLDIEEVRDEIEQKLKDLSRRSTIFSSVSCDRVVSGFDRLTSRTRSDELNAVMVHADLNFGNILVDTDADRGTVIDLTMTRLGCRYQDLADLCVHLERLAMKPIYRPSAVRALKEALLRGYDPALTEYNPLFQISLILQLTRHCSGLVGRRDTLPGRYYNVWTAWQLRRRLTALAGQA